MIEVGQSIILTGDGMELLPALPERSIRTCVTSPPYYWLRDYGVPGQLGLEQTPQEYVDKLVAVFRHVWRALCDDGTVWLNLGDSYAGSGKGGNPPDSQYQKQRTNVGSYSVIGNTAREAAKTKFAGEDRLFGFKPKDLLGIPWRVAFALQADGWFLRQDVIWAKPNPMPESVRDRCTKSHEYIFLLTKNAKYYFDSKAIQEPMVTGDTRKPYAPGQVDARGNGHDRGGGQQRKGYNKPYTGQSTKDYAANGAQDASATKTRIVDRILSGEITGRNKRSVWWVSTKPFKGAHFATFPPDLIEPCILAGSRPGDVVLDPFGGSGTVGMVSNRHGRQSVLIELNPKYVEIAKARLEKDLVDNSYVPRGEEAASAPTDGSATPYREIATPSGTLSDIGQSHAV